MGILDTIENKLAEREEKKIQKEKERAAKREKYKHTISLVKKIKGGIREIIK